MQRRKQKGVKIHITLMSVNEVGTGANGDNDTNGSSNDVKC